MKTHQKIYGFLLASVLLAQSAMAKPKSSWADVKPQSMLEQIIDTPTGKEQALFLAQMAKDIYAYTDQENMIADLFKAAEGRIQFPKDLNDRDMDKIINDREKAAKKAAKNPDNTQVQETINSLNDKKLEKEELWESFFNYKYLEHKYLDVSKDGYSVSIKKSYYDQLIKHIKAKGGKDSLKKYRTQFKSLSMAKKLSNFVYSSKNKTTKEKRLLSNFTGFLTNFIPNDGLYTAPEKRADLFMQTLKNTPYGDMSDWKNIVLKRNKRTCKNDKCPCANKTHYDLSGVAFYKTFNKRIKLFVVYAGTREKFATAIDNSTYFKSAKAYAGKGAFDWNHNATFGNNTSYSGMHGHNVHGGFYGAYKEGFDNAKDQIDNFINYIHSQQQTTDLLPIDVVCVGHSLGSAIATITGVEIKDQLTNLGISDVSTVNFFLVGTPRVYSKSAAKAVQKKLGYENIVRLVDNRDMVTHITLNMADFAGIGYKFPIPDTKYTWSRYAGAYYHAMTQYIKNFDKHFTTFQTDGLNYLQTELEQFEESFNTYAQERPIRPILTVAAAA